MTLARRIGKIVTALFTAFIALLLYSEGEDGLPLVGLILSASLILFGLRSLIFYFTMARHMVGGKSLLFRGIIVLDLAVFTISMVDDPKVFIILYLLGIHAFAGVTGVLRALEARRYGSPSWRWTMVLGIGNFTIAVLAVVAGFFLPDTKDLVYLYAGCLFYSACVQIASAFRKTAIVYIQ